MYESKLKLFDIIILFLFYLIIFLYINKNYKYFFCQKCIYAKKIEKKCSECNADILFKSLKCKSVDETLNELLNNNRSITRFGDGEFKIIFGRGTRFQKPNEKLKDKLLLALNSNIPNLIIGIVPLYKNKNPYWINFLNLYKFELGKIINKNRIYYNARISRFYNFKANKRIHDYIIKFKKIWNNRDILTIEGEKTRLGYGNDLFNNSKSIKRIICPITNAFNVYDKIFNYITNLDIDKDTLILISLGQTATALTYDIIKFGLKNQVIDFGHFDIYYEFYLRNATKKIRLAYKYVNEITEGRKNIIPISDSKYLNQIIYRIN